MKILIVGCGGIGGVFAAYLGRVADVTVYDKWPEHVQRINEEGLKLSGCSDFTTKVTAFTHVEQLQGLNFDYVLLAVKGYHTRTVMREIANHVQGAKVLSVQNGLGNEEIIADLIGEQQVLQGVTMLAGSVVEPGHIRHSIAGTTWFGPYAHVDVEPLQSLEERFRKSGLEAQLLQDPKGAVWSKFLFNISINPLSGILGLPSRDLVQIKEVRDIMQDILDEGKMIAEKLGIELLQDPEKAVFAPRPSKGKAHLASMGQDIAAGRRTEIDFLNGAVILRGTELGIQVPVNKTVTHMIKALEWKQGRSG